MFLRALFFGDWPMEGAGSELGKLTVIILIDFLRYSTDDNDNDNDNDDDTM